MLAHINLVSNRKLHQLCILFMHKLTYVIVRYH